MKGRMDPQGLDRSRRARQIVVRMAGILGLVLALSTVIWWQAGKRTFDRLGVIVSVMGIVMILTGLFLIAFHSPRRESDRTRMPREHSVPSVFPARRTRVGVERDRLLVLYFCGVGLLCLFAGSLIILGL
jgi:hypothetical protein